MSFTLDTLPQGLSQQFQKLMSNANTQFMRDTTVLVLYNSFSKAFLIDGFAGYVFVSMQGATQEITKGSSICGGSFCQFSVEVLITPENEQVIQVVEAHFKAQIKPELAMMRARPLFDMVIINGKEY